MFLSRIVTLTCFYFISATAAWAWELSEDSFEDAVVIHSDLPNGNMGICSGVLVAPTAVVTAAHCLQANTRIRVNRVSAVAGWVPEQSHSYHAKYDPTRSFSSYDIGIIRLKYPLRNSPALKTLCLSDHWGDSVVRVGFGGRDGMNQKKSFVLKETSLLVSTQTIVLSDPSSASGDSGGPIYAVENGRYCLFAVHSTIDLDGPMHSYNPRVSSFLAALKQGQ